MSIVDEHNRQHTYGNAAGPPSSVVGVSAQQAIDAHKRLVEGAGTSTASGKAPRGSDFLRLALGCCAFAAVAALIAYMVGGIGAVAIGLVAAIAGMFGVIFLVGALVSGAKSGMAGLFRGSASRRDG